MKKENPAKRVNDYLQAYKLHLTTFELEDDTYDITVTDLIDYVENQIDEEDLRWYGLIEGEVAP